MSETDTPLFPDNASLGEVRAFARKMLPREGPGVVLCRGHELFYMNAAAIARCPDISLQQALTDALVDFDPDSGETLICPFDGQHFEIRRLPPGPAENCAVSLEFITSEDDLLGL